MSTTRTVTLTDAELHLLLGALTLASARYKGYRTETAKAAEAALLAAVSSAQEVTA